MAWELLTRDFGLPKDKLLVTVYHDDEEAADLWRKVAGLPDERIIRIATSDNFWMMGPTGPCGPCSEIFYDHGARDRRRPAGQPRRERRPVHRDLEPRLHAVRAARGREPRPAAAPVDRHRHGARAHRGRAAGQARQLRHRPDARADRGRGPCDELGPGRARQGALPRHRRPPALDELPDRRRRAALERGPRLRAAPDHAPRDAPRPPARRGGPGDVPAGPGAGAADGPGLPGAGPRPRADRGDAAARGDPVQDHARPRVEASRRRTGPASRRRGAARRGGVPALRHLRLPARPDPGRAAREGARGRRRGLRGGDGRAEAPRPRRLGRVRGGRRGRGLADAGRALRRDRVPRLRHRDRRGRDPRDPARRRRGRRGRGRRRGPDRAEPDAVLRGVRRPGGRRRSAARRGGPGDGVGRAQARGPLRPLRAHRRRPADPRRRGAARRRP